MNKIPNTNLDNQFVFGDVVEILNRYEKGIVMDTDCWTDEVLIALHGYAFNNIIQRFKSKDIKLIETNRNNKEKCDNHPIWKHTRVFRAK